MADHSVFRSYLSRGRIEDAYRRVRIAQEEGRSSWAEIGMRAARARDEKLLVALEVMAETTGKMQDEQIGRTMRDPSATFAESRGTTEHQLFREAFRLADEGNPIPHFAWVYACAAILAGFII